MTAGQAAPGLPEDTTELIENSEHHKLPLRVGGSVDLLRCVYFVHEVIVATLRVDARLPAPAAA